MLLKQRQLHLQEDTRKRGSEGEEGGGWEEKGGDAGEERELRKGEDGNVIGRDGKEREGREEEVGKGRDER